MVTMSWSPPRHANGVIDHYVIRVTPSLVPSRNGCADIKKSNTALEEFREEKDVVSSTAAPPETPDNETESQQNTPKECCACPQEIKRQQLQKDITFEDALFKSVYTGHTLRQERDASSEEAVMLLYKYIDSSDLDDLSKIREPNATDYLEPQPHKDSPKDGRSEITRNTTITLSGLFHFTRYLVEVVACHHPLPKSPLNPDEKYVLCSLQPATLSFITRQKRGANLVTNITVVDGTKPGVKNIRWDPPEQPIGEIIAYNVILRPQDTVSHWSSNRFPEWMCITVQEFEENNKTFEINESDFEPGVYTLGIIAYTNPPLTYSNESYGYARVEIKPIAGASTATTALTIWGVVFAFFVMLMVVVGFVLCKTMSRKSDGFSSYNEHYIPAGPRSWSQRIHSMFPAEHILQMHDLELENDSELGQGNFGRVVPGKLNMNSTFVPIAAKVVTNSQAKDEILSEAKLMLKLDCYHLVKAYGVAVGPSQVYLVMECMSRGDLLHYLRSLSPRDNDIFSVLTYDQVCAMAVQIADGMAYLASYKIAHRDLAARNCLIDDQLNIKISDFGMSRLMGNDYYKINKTNCFPVRWLPPEYLTHERFTSQSDVWSYGVVLWEILSGGARPYKHLTEKMVWDQVKRGHTLESELPADTPEFLMKVVTNCWKFHDRLRPYFPQIISALFSYTSPCFAQHFRMVSFYHSGPGQDYKRQVEALQDAEAESDVTVPLTTPSSLHDVPDECQPPPLPSRPFLGLKWPSSLSFRVLPNSRAPQYSLASPISSDAPDKSRDDEHSFVMPEVVQDLSRSSPAPVCKRPDSVEVANARLTNPKTSQSFKNAGSPFRRTPVQHHSSASDLSTYSEGQPPSQRIDTSEDLGAPASSVIVNIDKKGAPSSSLTSPRSMTQAALGRVSKSFIAFRSISSPNIKPAAC